MSIIYFKITITVTFYQYPVFLAHLIHSDESDVLLLSKVRFLTKCGRPCAWEAECERPCGRPCSLIGLDRSVRESEVRSANQIAGNKVK